MSNDCRIIFIRGISGSGKSTISKLISQEIYANTYNPDMISIFNEEFKSFKKIHPEIERLKKLKYQFILTSVYRDIEKRSNVIWEQPWRNIKGIQKTIERLHIPNFYKIFLFTLNLNLNDSWRRIQENRSYHKNMYKNFSKFSKFNSRFEIGKEIKINYVIDAKMNPLEIKDLILSIIS